MGGVMAGYQIIAADPPWLFGDRLPGKKRGAVKHYPCMTLPELCDFYLPPIADDALLFIWKVASMPAEALAVVRAWGFHPKSELVWVKTTKTGKRHFGMGRYTRQCHETCIIATRGTGLSLIKSHKVRSVFDAPVGRHSEKPEAFFEIVRELCGDDVKRAELFARKTRPGWDCFGNEVEAAA
jgi:N6-adenosine-specific RNA methylase IME4